ncbi:MAG TPA: MerR family transcriptional regulator [Paucimonas sp.]|nr:MerR family transcriptional regulator [Paucimonas sp.]
MTYTIGEFSKITGLTVKAIHLYHEKRLLVPNVVDRETGYRYFDERNVEKARAVALLRDMEFSLAEIAEILDGHDDESEILGFLERKKEDIESRIRRMKSVSASIETILRHERDAAAMSATSRFDIAERKVEPVLIASIRWRGRYADSGKAFSRLGRAAGFGIAGKPLGLYYDLEYKEEDADIESCFPVRRKIAADGILCRELPAGECVSLLHLGPYDQLFRSYAKVFDYLQRNGCRAEPPIREIYHKGPGMIFKGNPRKYLTEIQIFVTR